jgi:hypothetical protein
MDTAIAPIAPAVDSGGHEVTRHLSHRHIDPPQRLRGGMLLAALGIGLVLTACSSSDASASALQSYLAAVEPIRLGVNHLLEDADPILSSYRDHRFSGDQATAAMSRLEQSFATCMVDINALQPSNGTLAGINAPYAHTFILEDSYLNALVAALPGGDFGSLPNTQPERREAIIEWRVLEILANAASVVLPADLQQAGRGEIAPSVSGSS